MAFGQLFSCWSKAGGATRTCSSNSYEPYDFKHLVVLRSLNSAKVSKSLV